MDEEVEDVWEVFGTDGGVLEVISMMEPVTKSITTEGAKKLFVWEVVIFKGESSHENDEDLPEGWLQAAHPDISHQVNLCITSSKESFSKEVNQICQTKKPNMSADETKFKIPSRQFSSGDKTVPNDGKMNPQV